MNMPEAPAWILNFFRWYCHPDYCEDLEGDLLERYADRLSGLGAGKAKRLLLWDVLLLFRPGLIKNLSGQNQLNQFGMFRNYIKVAFRIFNKEKGFTLINILGLALGISCSLFIYLWVNDELSYNTHLKNGDRVCFIMDREEMTGGDIHTYESSPYLLKGVLENEYPVVEQVAILSWGNTMAFEKDQKLMEQSGVDSSPEVFDMFEMKMLQGSSKRMKDHPKTIAISASFADSYFGDTWKSKNVIGSILVNEQRERYELVGIYEDFPKQSTLDYTFIIPFSDRLSKNKWLESWGNNGSQIYVKLANNVTLSQANEQLKNAIIDHRDDETSFREIFLQPFKDIYLYNGIENGKIIGGRIVYVRLLSIAAILIVLLASINFMNLSTAKSEKRAKETGVRKLLGARRRSLKFQFLTESVLITFLSMLVALLFVFLLLSQFNMLTGKQVHPDLFSLQSVSILIGFVLLLGIISGLYPAFYLSLLSISSSVKGSFKHKKYDVVFRKGLVVFQFVITIIMITSAVTIYRQVSYIQSRNIGIDRARLVSNQAHEMNAVKDYEVFKNELLKRPGIERMTTTNQDIMNIGNSTSDPRWQGKGEDEITEFYILATNPDFIPTAGINLKEGRNFDWDLRTDTANFIINESARRLMRMDKPIGQDLEFWDHKGKIVGVIGDFHNTGTHSPVKPLIIRYDLESNGIILTKTKPGQTQQALASLEDVYHLFNPKREFSYDFMDDLYNQQYKSDLMVKDLSLYFTILAIVISCLGLFALVAYTADRRTKEIGIRKVLGASLLNLLQLLSSEFSRLLVISFILAIPLAYYIMSGWLQDFAYKIDLSWWLFGMAGFIILAISYLIIGGQVIKSALVNPVESLKSE